MGSEQQTKCVLIHSLIIHSWTVCPHALYPLIREHGKLLRIYPCQFCLIKFSIPLLFHLNRPIDNIKLGRWLHNLIWTPESVVQWQEFYNKAPRLIIYDRGSRMDSEVLPIIPKYEDIKFEPCNKKEIQNSTDQSRNDSNNSMASQQTLFLFTLIFFVLRTVFG